jgi:hypothetical protein
MSVSSYPDGQSERGAGRITRSGGHGQIGEASTKARRAASRTAAHETDERTSGICITLRGPVSPPGP